MAENNTIQFNFSYYALNLLGKQMYTNRWSAISELVANGLDAGASEVKLYINSIDKKRSVIEIIDNGSGMSFDDLATKYALIGRNRRLMDNSLSDKVKGRKGIGKLATLFLSKKYYIVSKKDDITSAWLLDSTNAVDNDIPELKRVDIDEVNIDNLDIWNSYSSGTVIKLVDVNMTGFAETKLESLKIKLSDYYLLDKINASIEVAYVTKARQKIVYEKVEKKIAFKNFYTFFENDTKNKSKFLADSVLIQNSKYQEFREKKREVIKLSKVDFPEIVGKRKLTSLNGKTEMFDYELKGWIGIHSTINSEEARENDKLFLRNDVYKPNRLKLYVRDKLAVENFLDYLNNTQAMRSYIEGEISFDILDDSRLEDISTSSREGFSREDERVQILIEILKPIINRLITERNKISSVIRREDQDEDERVLNLERIEKRKEREARRQEQRVREKLEEKTIFLEERNSELVFENNQLENQNVLQKVLLEDKEPRKQELFVHELNTVSDGIKYTINDLADDFYRTNEYDRVKEYILDFKRSADRLNTIKRQFLKLGTYDLIGKQMIDLKSYIKSYIKVSPYRNKIIDEIDENEFGIKIDVFEFSTMLDNLISNAVDNEGTQIELKFEDTVLKITSDTAPIMINPIDKIFDLGTTTKEYGTGIGLYLVKEICDDYGWDITVSQDDENVSFEIQMG